MSTPFFDEEFTFTQPDGTEVKVRGTGNQHSASFETLDGMSVVRDRYTGVFHYGSMADDGTMLVPAGPLGAAPLMAEASLAKGMQALPTGFEESDRPDNGLPPGEMRWQERRRQKLQEVLAVESVIEAGGPMLAPPQRHTVGTFVGLTLLVDFSDFSQTISQGEVADYCNQPGYSGFNNKGSVHDYFKDVSGGKLLYTNIVAPWFRAQHPRSYYTDREVPFGRRAQELIREALAHHRQNGFDFSALTTDDLNYVYAVNVFYAGTRDNNWSEGLWPHAHFLNPKVTLAPGIIAHDYQITDMTAELSLGTFCHENGHLICDFPDLYDYDGSSYGVGSFCLMCAGGSRPNHKNPAHVGAYLKHAAGWADSAVDAIAGQSVTLQSGSNEFLIHRRNKVEYFIIENRQKNGRDSGLPAGGLAIWHVDETGNNSHEQGTPNQHYECAIIQADGKKQIERKQNQGDAGDLYHAGTSSSFTETTNPASKWWNGNKSGLALTNISASGNAMQLDVS